MSKKLSSVIVLAGMLAGSLHAGVVPISEDSYHRYEWRASTFAPSGQTEAAVDVTSDGNILVTWSSRRQQGGQYGVYAQRFTPQGVALGSETCLNLWTRSHQWLPDIAAGSADGPIWVVWQSHGQDGFGGSIIARIFNDQLDGSSEILVNQEWQGHQQAPVVAVSPQNHSLVAWVKAKDEGAGLEIHARLFNADGSPMGDEFAIREADGCTHMPSIAFAADGSFAVAYARADEHMAPLGIRMQRFDAEGNPEGEAIDVCGEVRESQIEPVIAALQDGYVVAWLDGETDGDDYGVVARRFDAQGCPDDEFAFLVNTSTKGLQNGIAIAVAPQGHYAIAYNSNDDDGTGIFAKIFAPNGAPIGREFRINERTQNDQAMRVATGTNRLAFGPGGELICAWSGDGGFNDRSSANVTMLSPRPLELVGVTQGVTDEMEPSRFRTADLTADALAGPHQPPTFDPRPVPQVDRKIVRIGRDIGFTGITNTGWKPPDPIIAVGPEHIVLMTNGAIAFYTKDGTQTFIDEIEDSYGFWGSVGATSFVFDPETFYDPLSGRFFAMAAEAYAPGSKSYVLIAVSDDSDPNGTWYKYRFDTSGYAGYLFDSPNIGVDDEALYITGDGFGLGAVYPVYIYDKASFLVGNPPAITNSFLLSTSTQSAGIPAVTFDDPPGLYLIEHQEGSNRTHVRLIAVQDPLGSPTIQDTLLSVPAYSAPGTPPQKGTSVRPKTFDARFWSATYRGGSMWGTHHINSSPVLARWYEIEMRGWPDSGLLPQLVQSGEIAPGDGIHTFYGSIDADAQGNAAMTVARSSYDEYISMRTTYRLAGDPLGTFREDVSQAESNAPYTFDRWGDYSGTRWDPVDPGRFWGYHEFAINNSWQTWVAGVDTCRAADVDCNGVVDIDDVFAVLAAWGPCPGCPEDVDGSGVVDIDDLFAVLADWG
ncbi:MAG: hypothetical protein JSV91_02185 [Phycisphaerales bacterium]|nr:MAG: hypothetical protein JSV91_02185 [Phycisphaerales bacterium]